MASKSAYWKAIITDGLHVFDETYQDTLRFLTDEVIPSFTEPQPLEVQQQWLAGVPWLWLRENAPEMWKMLSQQQVEVERALMRRERRL